MYSETIDHLFINCIEAKNYFFEIRNWLEDYDLYLPACNIENIILGVDDVLVNFIILLYKLSLYKCRDSLKVHVSLALIKNLLKHYINIEQKIALKKID